MNFLTVEHISKKHGDETVLKPTSFTQAIGHNIAIAGETGSGKTTLLRIVAGLEQSDGGIVLFEGKQVKGVDEKLMPGHKGIAYLSQHFELPNKYHVAELLAYANDLSDEDSEQLYNVCDIQHLLHRWSHTLSGGEKQRVALAKLLTTAPRLLILDEPYSNLDLIHKLQLKAVVASVIEKLGVTCILVSHEPADILPWADEVLVMRHGAIVQQGTPKQVYTTPNSEYVAGLFGKYNTISPKLAGMLALPGGTSTWLRPEQLTINTINKGIPATVSRVLYLGGRYEVEVVAEGQTLTVDHHDENIAIGMQVYVNVAK